MPRTKVEPSLEDAFKNAFAETSRVRRRNQFTKALDRFRNEPKADTRLLPYLLDGMELVHSYQAEQIAQVDLPRFGRAILPKLRKLLTFPGTKADAFRLTAIVQIDPVAGLKLCDNVLNQGSDVVRAAALKSLRKLDCKKAEQIALEGLTNKKGGIAFQNIALELLASSRSDAALSLLLAALSRPRIVWAAWGALRQSPHPKVAARLLPALTALVAEIEAAGGLPQPYKGKGFYLGRLMSLLVDRPEPAGLIAVIKLMEHPLEGIRRNATSIVWHHINNHAVAGKRAIPELAAALKYSDKDARIATAIVLGRGKEAAKAAVPALIERLQSDTEEDVRRQVAESLGTIGTPAKPIVQALKAALDDECVWVRRQAIQSLGRVGPPARDATPLLLKQLDSPNEDVTRDIADVLFQIGPLNAVLPTLIDLLGHRHSNLRGLAANVIGKIGAPARAAIPGLIVQLGDSDSWVRWRAVEALGTMGSLAREAVPPLTALLNRSAVRDRDGWFHNHYIRAAAAAALAKIGLAARDALPVLESLRTDKDRKFRPKVAEAIAAIEGS